MALATVILCGQEKVGEHHAQRQSTFSNPATSLESHRGMQLFNR